MLQRNGFKGGMNKDADSSVMPPDFYLDAHNLTLTGDGKFFALENVKGTTELGVLDISFFGEVMAVYENRYTIGTDTNVRCLTIFTSESGGDFQIWCYRLDTNAIKKLFAQSFDADFEAASPEIDAVVYPEGGLDIIYFTDNYNELRKLRCEIPTGASDNFLKENDLSLQRRATLLNPTYTVNTGGGLASGSYQFVFRFYNIDTNSYSRWTIPSHPVNVSAATGEGYYNLKTAKKIDIDLDVLDSEIPFWSHFQVGVIENITPQVQTAGALQKLQELTGGSVMTPGFTNFTYSYKTNERISDLALSDVVVDLAAIEKAKTIQVKNNRLFVGNVRYSNLEYDRTPTLTSGNFLPQDTLSLQDDNNSTRYRGYFRGEVYRFYVVYWDENYNLSRPIHLDLSSVTDNTLTNGDVKFPERGGNYTLLNGSNSTIQLGLSIGITNHPSWARGFAIFRAKRRKNKLFQTPLVPAVEIAGMDALGEYPNTAYDSVSTSTTYEGATPMNPLGTLVPKNLFHTVAQNIVQINTDVPASNNQPGECRWVTTEFYTGVARNFGFIFEPFNQYGLSDPYTPTSSDTIRVVDMAYLKLDWTNFESPTTYAVGDYLGTNVHGTFYAANNIDFWKQYGTSPSYPPLPLMPQTLSVSDYTVLDNFGEGTSLGGSDVCKFSNLQTGGIDLYVSPNNQRMGVIQHTGMTDPSYYSNTFLASKVPAGFFKSSSAVAGASGTVRNEFVTTFTVPNTFVENSSYVGAVAIVDIESGLGDDRYGDSDTLHDMVFTGAYYTFTDAEVAAVESSGAVGVGVSVFGGDCYVSTHNFKISDNHFSLINRPKSNGDLGVLAGRDDLSKRWKRVFNNRYGWVACMPTGLKTVSQVLSVVLESEINGEVLAKRPYTTAVGRATSTQTEGQAKIAFPYLYSRGYTQSSDQKALVPFSTTEQITTDYRARVLYSDQKVYNSDIQGFDVFRVSNFTDLDESYYGLTKLTLDGDNLIAIQEQGLAVLPVDASLLSTTDGATISVRSGTTDLPVYLSRIYGSQHLKSVIRSGDAAFFVDNRNQRVFRLGGGQLDIISDKGMVKQFNSDLASSVAQIRGMWDNNRAHYWVFNEDFCYLWDDRLKLWVGSHDVSPDDGVYTSEGLLTISTFDDRLAVHKMYDGEYNSFYTQTVTPKVSFVVNAEYENNKVFDTIIAYSNGKMDSLDVVTGKENGAFGGESLGTTFAYNRREGYYTVPTLRDIHGARMRGTYAEVTIYWPTDNEKITLSQVVTAYRNSPRLPQ